MTNSLNWSMRTLRNPPYFAGYQFTTCLATIQETSGPRGQTITMVSGGSVFQRTAADRLAPVTIAPDSWAMALEGITDAEARMLQRLKGISTANPVEMFIEQPRTCEWAITAGRTSWTLDRSTAFGLVAYADYTPTAAITDVTGGNETALTVITTGTPTSTELLIDSTTTNGTTVTTTNLSASVGKLLVLTYHPLRLVTIAELEREYSAPDVGKQNASLELVEYVPARVWI